MNSKRLLSAGVILLWAIGGCAPYEGYRTGSPFDPLHGVERLAGALKLSEEQRVAIGALRAQLQKDEIRNRADLEAALIDLRRLTRESKDRLDEAQILQKVDEVGNLETALRRRAVEAGLSLAKILTVEQYERLGEIVNRTRGY